MMKILEDANEVVRETAKEVVIELFKYPQTPPHPQERFHPPESPSSNVWG
jgi:hypothetical protein